MGLLTKVATGVAFGDVSNVAVRNVLTEISKSVFGGITEQEMEDTMAFFDWKCPYTGRELKDAVDKKDGTYATDHLYSQNREWCGLNVKGNLIIVDRKANSAKGGMDVKTFMETDSDFWRDLGVDKATRLARLEKIEEFQAACGYDPHKVRSTVSPLLVAYYDEVRVCQERMIAECLEGLDKVGLPTLTKAKPAKSAATATAPASTKRRKTPELVFFPADEAVFKDELIKCKKACIVLTYDSGKVISTPWDARRMDASSNLRSNIQGKTFWRNGSKEGLVKVEVYLD